MPDLKQILDVSRCPHCGVDKPNLTQNGAFDSIDYTGTRRRFWRSYICLRCGGLVLAAAKEPEGKVEEIYPTPFQLDDTIPLRARSYLDQAFSSLHVPAGAVMLAASSVDAMLKEKGYKKGSLYSRIDQAAKDHLITNDMARWAHEVRLDANDQRHADEGAPLPTETDAKRSLDFVMALGQFLFVLPARVERGLKKESPPEDIQQTTETKYINQDAGS